MVHRRASAPPTIRRFLQSGIEPGFGEADSADRSGRQLAVYDPKTKQDRR